MHVLTASSRFNVTVNHNRHCERSEAIQSCSATGLPHRYASRNDDRGIHRPALGERIALIFQFEIFALRRQFFEIAARKLFAHPGQFAVND